MILNELPPFKSQVTAALTEHRALPRTFDDEKLKRTLREVAERGFEIFLVGMAVGFDTHAFRALDELKEEGLDIKIYAAIPCLDQASRFTQKSKEEYDRLVSRADGKIVLYEKFDDNSECMLVRNRFMVDNASLLVAYYRGGTQGGTAHTIHYAEKKGIEIVTL